MVHVTVKFTLQEKTRSPAIAKVGPTVLVVTDVEGHLRPMIFFMSSERMYATSY